MKARHLPFRALVLFACLALASLSCQFLNSRIGLSPTPTRANQASATTQPTAAAMLSPSATGAPRTTPTAETATGETATAPAATLTPDLNETPIPTDAFLYTGVWESTADMPEGVVYTNLTLTTSGTFTLYRKTETAETTDSGHYAVVGHQLFFYVTDHQPKMTANQPSEFPTMFFYVIDPIDNNTLLVGDPVAQERWEMKRTGFSG